MESLLGVPQQKLQLFNSSPKAKLAFAFVYMLVLHISLRAFFESVYQVNDDTAMLSFLNGSFTGNNEANTVFMHPWVGGSLATLYSFLPDVSWYPYFLLILTMFALISLAYFVNSAATLLTWLLATSLAIFSLTIEPTFTVASLICAVCGLIGIWITSLQANVGLRRIAILVFSAITLIAFLLRIQSIFFSVGIVAPLLIAFWYLGSLRNVSSRKPIIVTTLFILSVILSSLMAHRVQFSCKSSEQCVAWQEFANFNEVRGAIHGTPNISTLSTQLEELGWSSNDLLLFTNWLYPDDKETFFFPISNSTSSIQSPLSIIRNQDALVSGMNGFLRGESNFFVGYIAFLLLFVLLLRRHRSPLSNRLVGIIVSGWVLLGILISTLYRFPLRISFSFLVSSVIVAFGALVFLEQIDGRPSPKVRHSLNQPRLPVDGATVNIMLILLTITALVVPLIGERGMLQRSHMAKKLNSDSIEFQKDIKNVSLSAKVLVSPSYSNLYSINPWKKEDWFFDSNSLSFGWPVFSPHQEVRQKNLEIDSMFRDLLDSQGRYFFCGNENEAMLIATYLTEDSNRPVSSMRSDTKVTLCESWEFQSIP